VGGLLLIFGLFTPLGVAAAVGMTANAVIAFHPSIGFFESFGAFPLLLCLAAVAIAFVGPGALSLDRGRSWVHGDSRSAMAGIGLGVVAAIVALLIKVI
jgi:putative oxidoreductase